MVMSFEEWCEENLNDTFEEYSMDYYAGQFSHHIKEAWNHQQQKIDTLQKELNISIALIGHAKEDIDTLQKENEMLKNFAIKLISVVQNNHGPHDMSNIYDDCGDDECIGCMYAEKYQTLAKLNQ